MSLVKGTYCRVLIFISTLLLVPGSSSHYEPEFDLPLPNLTAKQGTDVSFICVVKHLGDFKVAWIRSDDKVIIAWHTHMVTHNNRYHVTHNGHNTWTLNIKNVQQNDSGNYMCTVNTEPQKNQIGKLEVVVPADIIDDETSNDVVVTEFQPTILKCKATGYPPPKVRWKREDEHPLSLSRELLNPGEKVHSWEGEKLPLRPLTRIDTGSYLCIANNSVPPPMSKRVMVYVHFHPLIKVSDLLVAAPIGTNVTLECYVEGVPKPFFSWTTKDGQLIMSVEGRYISETEMVKDYAYKMRLTIIEPKAEDFRDYNCSASNSIGQASASVKLYKIEAPPTQRPTLTTTQTTTTKASLNERREKHERGRSHHKKLSKGQSGSGRTYNGFEDYEEGRISTPPAHISPRDSEEKVGSVKGSAKPKDKSPQTRTTIYPPLNSWKNEAPTLVVIPIYTLLIKYILF